MDDHQRMSRMGRATLVAALAAMLSLTAGTAVAQAAPQSVVPPGCANPDKGSCTEKGSGNAGDIDQNPGTTRPGGTVGPDCDEGGGNNRGINQEGTNGRVGKGGDSPIDNDRGRGNNRCVPAGGGETCVRNCKPITTPDPGCITDCGSDLKKGGSQGGSSGTLGAQANSGPGGSGGPGSGAPGGLAGVQNSGTSPSDGTHLHPVATRSVANRSALPKTGSEPLVFLFLALLAGAGGLLASGRQLNLRKLSLRKS